MASSGLSVPTALLSLWGSSLCHFPVCPCVPAPLLFPVGSVPCLSPSICLSLHSSCPHRSQSCDFLLSMCPCTLCFPALLLFPVGVSPMAPSCLSVAHPSCPHWGQPHTFLLPSIPPSIHPYFCHCPSGIPLLHPPWESSGTLKPPHGSAELPPKQDLLIQALLPPTPGRTLIPHGPPLAWPSHSPITPWLVCVGKLSAGSLFSPNPLFMDFPSLSPAGAEGAAPGAAGERAWPHGSPAAPQEAAGRDQGTCGDTTVTPGGPPFFPSPSQPSKAELGSTPLPP